MRGIPIILCIALGAHAATAADLPTNAAPTANYDWSGYFLGAHFGDTFGSSQWQAMQSGAPDLSGTLTLQSAYNLFSGTGSYSLGLQTGYNSIVSRRWLIGAEADVSFPNYLGADTTFVSAPGEATNYLERVEFSGTLRARVGYTFGNYLLYATGGLAWTFDQFTRQQIVTASTTENLFLVPRFGGVGGLGVEIGLTSSWAARIEYLYADYASRGVDFPISGQRFNSALALQTVRVGLDYQLGHSAVDPAIFNNGISDLELDRFALHGQTTFIEQYDPPFHSPYIGAHSLDPKQGRESWDVMYFVGTKLWQGAELWIDPELDQGFGLSNTEGIAGFPSGASFKVGASVPYARISRAFVRQTVDLGGDSEKVSADQNQFEGVNTLDRLVITVGKYSVSDVFDQNKYAQNPRKDFMNWALIDAGTFDYAADAWGYSLGARGLLFVGDWTLRGGLFDLSTVPNGEELDPHFSQFQWLGEIERRYELWSHPGKIAVTGFLTRARLGTYDDAIALGQATGLPTNIGAVRQYRSRTGLSGNLEQELTSDLGLFARAGFADGNVEPDSYTDVDRTVAAGLSLKGNQWGRPNDTFAIAGIINGISKAHQEFLNDGGLGILVGDGQLPHPGLEHIIETYYLFPILKWNATIDYQFVVNPAYNRDRGPVSIIGFRAETDF